MSFTSKDAKDLFNQIDTWFIKHIYSIIEIVEDIKNYKGLIDELEDDSVGIFIPVRMQYSDYTVDFEKHVLQEYAKERLTKVESELLKKCGRELSEDDIEEINLFLDLFHSVEQIVYLELEEEEFLAPLKGRIEMALGWLEQNKEYLNYKG